MEKSSSPAAKGQLGTEIIKQLREGRSEIGPIPEKL